MTVSELRAALAGLPDDMKVEINVVQHGEIFDAVYGSVFDDTDAGGSVTFILETEV